MAEGIYEKLREHLDSLPTGYPKTQSGVELKILRKLFTEEEAEMACQLKMVPETAEQVAERLGRNPKAALDLLSRMSQKGLILRVRFNGATHYMAAMFVIGILEFQLKNLDREMAEIFDEYMEESFGRGMIGLQTPQLRVVPVKESLEAAMEIQPYDELRKIVESQKTIVLARTRSPTSTSSTNRRRSGATS